MVLGIAAMWNFSLIESRCLPGHSTWDVFSIYQSFPSKVHSLENYDQTKFFRWKLPFHLRDTTINTKVEIMRKTGCYPYKETFNSGVVAINHANVQKVYRNGIGSILQFTSHPGIQTKPFSRPLMASIPSDTGKLKTRCWFLLAHAFMKSCTSSPRHSK